MILRRSWWLVCFSWLVWSFAPSCLAEARASEEKTGEEKAKTSTPEVTLEAPTGKYIRLIRDDKGRPLELQTAIVRFVADDEVHKGLEVDLVAAVHIGETSYYEELNKQFGGYDALLYELVAPEGTRVPKGGAKSDHPVSRLQTGMKNLLDLDFQLDHVDYQSKNFVHADMSPDSFSKSMNERGESIWALVFRMLGQSLAEQNKGEKSVDAELLLALFDKNRALALKRVLAEQFEDLEGMMSAFNGPDGSTLITERNKRALEVLGKEIGSGKKRLAIFYGAGHMPDMARRLIADFKLKPASESWVTAWDLHDAARKGKSKPAKEGKPKREKAATADEE
ncbi:MAG TPA: hypothetical protein VG826_33630 [Pirellulales bacterium]|nr:hypothetical protein [Pirellulales bacterium]